MAATSGSGSGNSRNSSGARGEQQVGSSTGYPGDKESSIAAGVVMSPPPCLIDVNPKNRHKPPSNEDEVVKRRKIHEQNYDATLVRADLDKAGHAYQPLMLLRPRINPNIDISTAKHSYSSEKGEKSPFLHEPADHGTCADLTDFGQTYMDLLAAARPLYDKPTTNRGVSAISRSRSRSESSDADAGSSDGTTSFANENESDDTRNSIQVVNARLDDGLPEVTEEPPQLQRTTQIISCPASSSLSMEEAVGVCDRNRLVTLSTPPYKILFVNSSFDALTGVPSHETLGKTLYDFVSNPTPLSLDSCAATSSTGQYTHVDLSTSQLLDLRMKVTPVVSSRHGAVTNVTHFVVDLAEPPAARDEGVQHYDAKIAIQVAA